MITKDVVDSSTNSKQGKLNVVAEANVSDPMSKSVNINANSSEIKIAVTNSILNEGSLLIQKDDLTKFGDEVEVVFFDANGKELSRILISAKQNAKITNLHNGLHISIRPSQEIKLNQLNNNLKLNSTND